MRRKQLAAAIDVRWTPEIAARVKGRLGERIAARRQRRRRATMLVTIVVIGAGGLALALLGDGLGPKPRAVAPARPLGGRAPAAAVAAAPVVVSPPEAPTAESLKPAPRPSRAPRTATPAKDVVGDLLAAADAARLGGRPEDAVVPLTEIATHHATDARAAIAAFQLGRVLADDLNDPARAEEAFTRAYDLNPSGPLAADAEDRALRLRARSQEAR
jgi:hypothetical protein